MKIHVKFYGQLSEVTGRSEMQVDAVVDTAELISRLEGEFPRLGQHRYLVAVNRKLVTLNYLLRPGNEVAFLPPFSGG